MQLITFTNLYPSRDMPRHGIFVEERLRHLIATGKVAARVVALRPSHPDLAAMMRRVSREKTTEVRAGIKVDYQRVPTLPMVSNWIDPWTWAAAAEPALKDIVRQSPGQLILDAHFLYPDGVAAAILGRKAGIPVVLSARGSDVNVKCLNPVMRIWVQWAARRSGAIIAVSSALARRIEELNIKPPILEVIPNGVDLEKFRRRDKEQSRRRFGVTGMVVASVGHLLADKGHQLALEALVNVPAATLLIAGEGPLEAYLRSHARKLGVYERVHFAGSLSHDDMPYVYSAADVLVLPSAREGMPNVILESLACGTRVVATDVGGIREVVRSKEAGVLMAERSASGVLDGLARLEAAPVTAQATREYAVQFGWQNVVGRQASLYQTVLANFRN